MLLNLASQSFATAKVAAFMGCTPQAVTKRADKHVWEEEPYRTQGGGKVWRFASMDEEAQQAVSLACIQEHTFATPDACDAEMQALWEAFNKKTDKAKERAFYKHSLLLECWRLHLAGTPITQAFVLVAQKHSVSVGNLRNWYFGTGTKKGVRGYDSKDWPALLVDGYKGRVSRAECDETAWEWLKKDYLRLEQPSFSRSFLRMKRIVPMRPGCKSPHGLTA